MDGLWNFKILGLLGSLINSEQEKQIMKYLISIMPEGERENEYATPCTFIFDSLNDAIDFTKKCLESGDVYVEISSIKK